MLRGDGIIHRGQSIGHSKMVLSSLALKMATTPARGLSRPEPPHELTCFLELAHEAAQASLNHDTALAAVMLSPSSGYAVWWRGPLPRSFGTCKTT